MKISVKKQKKISHNTMIMFIVSGIGLVMGVAMMILFSYGSDEELVVSGKLRVPPHLVDFISQNRTLFVALFRASEARPIAAAKEPILIKSTPKTRSEGYTRRFAITLSKLEYMSFPGESPSKTIEQSLKIALSRQEKEAYHLRLIVDRDGQRGVDTRGDLRSKKTLFYLGQRDLVVLVDQKDQ